MKPGGYDHSCLVLLLRKDNGVIYEKIICTDY